MRDLVEAYDAIHGLWSKHNYWFSHAPIHPTEMRSRQGCIHGHTHDKLITNNRYFNACIEHTGWKPITFKELINER